MGDTHPHAAAAAGLVVGYSVFNSMPEAALHALPRALFGAAPRTTADRITAAARRALPLEQRTDRPAVLSALRLLLGSDATPPCVARMRSGERGGVGQAQKCKALE